MKRLVFTVVMSVAAFTTIVSSGGFNRLPGDTVPERAAVARAPVQAPQRRQDRHIDMVIALPAWIGRP